MSEAPKTLFFESIVRNEQRGMNIVDELALRFTYHTKEVWKEKISQGFVTINGELATLETIVQAKDKVVYRVENYSEPSVPTDFETLYKDDEFLIVSKPAGIPVHHTGHIFYNTFVGVVRRALHNEELTPMHRLDRDTGGIMIFAEDKDTSKRFEKSLDYILLRKIYVAIVRGEFPSEEVTCEMPLREDPSSDIRIKMFPFADGKPCKTVFRRVAVFKEKIGDIEPPFSVVEAEIFTGRKHQIRAHLSYLGYPVVGDKLYSFDGEFYKKLVNGPLSDEDFQKLGAHTQMLFAHRALIKIPGKEARWFVAHKFTDEMSKVLEQLPQPLFDGEAPCSEASK